MCGMHIEPQPAERGGSERDVVKRSRPQQRVGGVARRNLPDVTAGIDAPRCSVAGPHLAVSGDGAASTPPVRDRFGEIVGAEERLQFADDADDSAERAAKAGKPA